MTTTIAPFQDAAGWERALYAFLAEKERCPGSRRTVEGYSRMLQHLFGTLGKPPNQVTSLEVFAWAYGKGLSGKEPSPVTIGARPACLSPFYRFLIRMEIVASNPCDQIERPKTSPSPPRGLSAEEIRRLLEVVPGTPTGLRDRASILTLTLTGQRRFEVLNLKAGDLAHEGQQDRGEVGTQRLGQDRAPACIRRLGRRRGPHRTWEGFEGVLFVLNGMVDFSPKVTPIYDYGRRRMGNGGRRDRLTELLARSWRKQLIEGIGERDPSGPASPSK